VLLAYLLWSFLKTWTLSDVEQRARTMDEAASSDPGLIEYRKDKRWEVPDEVWARVVTQPDALYWTERYFKASYLVGVYQLMRILVRRYGSLTDAKCQSILRLPQLTDVANGAPVASLSDFREGSALQGPLWGLAHLLRVAVRYVVLSSPAEFRSILSPQQILLQPRWVALLSQQVDQVVKSVGIRGWVEANGIVPTGQAEAIALETLLPPIH
jgi:hypothetical protein